MPSHYNPLLLGPENYYSDRLLERKFEEQGVKKVIPDRVTLESTYKLAILTGRANVALAKLQEEWDANGHGIEVPADLETRISSLMTENAKPFLGRSNKGT